MQSPITISPRAAAVKPLAPRLDEPAKPLEWVTLEDILGRRTSLAIHGRDPYTAPGYFHVVGNLEHGVQVKPATPEDAAKLADFVTGGQFSELLEREEERAALVTALKLCKIALKDHLQYDDGYSLERDGFNAAVAALASVRGEKEAV